MQINETLTISSRLLLELSRRKVNIANLLIKEITNNKQMSVFSWCATI